MTEPSAPGPPPAPSPTPEEAPHALSHRVSGLSCPNCGGVLEVETGLRVVRCGFCATTLLVLSEIGIRRFAVEPQIEAAQAREIGRRWLATGWKKDPRLRREARLAEAFLCFLPFYRVEADCIGVALGTEQRRRTVGSGKSRRTETYEVDVERTVERSFDRTYPALNVAEWGIRRVDLRGDPLVPFDPRGLGRLGMVFAPTGSEVAVREDAVEDFKAEANPAAGLHRVRFSFLESLRERLSVVYYPLWVVRYHFQERSYQLLVDAQDGSLGYGKAPGNDFYRAAMLVLTQAVALYAGTTALQFGGIDFGGLVFVGLVVGGALIWGWRRFRYGGVVIEGTGAEPEAGFRQSIRRLFERGPSLAALGEVASGRLKEGP